NARLRGARDRAERNQQHALAAAGLMTAQIAERVRPIAGTESTTVEAILNDVAGVYDDLLREDPSPAAVAGKAEMLTAFADIDLEMNKTARAALHADQAVGLFQQLCGQDPGSARYQAGLADGQEVQGRVRLQQGDLAAALAAFRASQALRERLSEREPDSARRKGELARSLTWVGGALEQQGDE